MPRVLILAAALLLAAPAFAQQPVAALSPERETELRASILSATQAPDFDKANMLLEVYRTLRGVGVTLSSAEAFEMGEEARKRANPGEALQAYSLLNSDDEEFRNNTVRIALVREQAAQDIAGDIEKSAEVAKQRNTVFFLSLMGEVFAAQGKHERAIAFYETALSLDEAKSIDVDVDVRAAEASRLYGRAVEFYLLEFKDRPCGAVGSLPQQLCPVELARVQLNYGISQFKSGRTDEARATWAAIQGSPSVEILAKAWIGLADDTVR